MSTNEQLVLRAEQAAQQTAQNKAEIEAMVTKLEQVQAPAIAEAKEDIKQALIEKGQTVDDSVPFSEYGNKVRAIDNSGVDTSDATVTENDILNGKTAYGSSGKITGNIPTVTATLTDNVTTVPKGYISEAQTLTVAEASSPTTSENVVTINKGYQVSQQEITVGTAKATSTITPGTSDVTISKGTYLSGDQTIKGDVNLIADNIKEGVSIFTVNGTFTSDADATASDIAQGKTAYVKGEKVTGTATGGGAVSPMWEYESWKIRTNRPPCNTYNVPSRGDSSARFGILDGNLIDFNPNIPKKYDETINWTYVSARNSSDYAALGDGKLYWLSSTNSYTATPLFPSLSGITQVGHMTWGTLCCTGSGELYGGGGNNLTKVRRVEYTREKDTDPIEYVSVSKILNCPQDYTHFWVITADGSLASGWLDKEAFDYSDGAAYAEIDTQSVANGNPFLNYFPQSGDGYDYGDNSTQTYELAFRADGLWYREPGQNNVWSKAVDPGLRKTDWLGYCSLYLNENYEGWDEETGQEIYTYSFNEYEVALHIDEQGRLWKIAAKGELISDQYGGKELKLTGLEITQVGEDTDWQCVTPVIIRNKGQAGKFNGVWGQKGGKVVNLRSSNSDIVEIAWEEYPVPFSGKMICVEGNKMYFAPEGVTVDLTKAGGTY